MNEDTKIQKPRGNGVLPCVSGSALPVTRVNHGDVWGRKDGSSWYTFYCPKCKRQLEKKADCPHCKQEVDWSV